MPDLKPGIYRHFKGKEYEVISLARNSETLEIMVIYRALYSSKKFGENALWVRPYKIFIEEVKIEGRKVPRFAFVR